MRSILVTGAQGFIGSNLFEALARSKENEVVKYCGDLKAKIAFRNNFDIVYHLAANTETRKTNDWTMYRDNVYGFINIMDFVLKSRNADGTKLIWASSAAVTGNGTGPLNAYAHSKLICEQIAKRYQSKNSIVTLRFFNVFGPGELQKGNMASMITRWASQIRKQKQPQAFYREPAKRDHIYVKDVVKACLLAQTLDSGIYDVGSGKAVGFLKVLKLVQKALDNRSKPEWIKNPYKKTFQKFTQANLDWGFEPDYSLWTGIKEYIHENFPRHR